MYFFCLPQALEDHTIHHAKILKALEDEKQKIAEEIQTLQKNRASGNKTVNSKHVINAAGAVISLLHSGFNVCGS